MGFYCDENGKITHAVGQSIGMEIREDERPIVILFCPGVGNIDSTYWYEGWTHEEDGKIIQDDTGKEVSLEEAVRYCCENGDISSVVEAIQKEIEEIEEEEKMDIETKGLRFGDKIKISYGANEKQEVTVNKLKVT